MPIPCTSRGKYRWFDKPVLSQPKGPPGTAKDRRSYSLPLACWRAPMGRFPAVFVSAEAAAESTSSHMPSPWVPP